MTLNTFGELWDPVRRWRRSVLLRLLVTVLLFSCVVTLILTALQLYRDYYRGEALVANRLIEIDKSYRDSLGEALWRLDRDQLQLELDGILRLADIRAAQVREVGSAAPMVVTAGQRAAHSAISNEFPLLYRVRGREQEIGTLYVEATLSDLYDDLKRTALVILVSQAANTFVVSLFTIYILYLLVTRHLGTIARFVGRYDFRQPPQALTLNRARHRHPDELDHVVTAFNAMGARLCRAYHDEREAADEREARRLAEAANRAKAEFLANMSHELRTPLNGILGYAQILRRDGTLDERQRDGITVIQKSGEHLLVLIEDILDFAKIEAGKMRLEMSDVSLSGLLPMIQNIIRVKAEQKGLAFVCELAQDAPSGVRADERRLRQVLLNLLANAVKFTERGSVSLRVTRSAFGAAVFEVRDTGIGICEDQLETIFEPFVQASGGECRRDGTGLGLAISRQLVRTMGSEIRVESEIGQGSAFRFQLMPALAPQAGLTTPAPPSEQLVTGYEGPRRKLMIVDDDETNRQVAADLLSRLGFATIEAENGLAAIERAQAEQPALVLTDIVMPVMDGIEAMRRLRRMPQFAELPIIAVSASPSGTDEQKSLEAGANAFISKPIDFDKLLAQMGVLLQIDWQHAPRAEASDAVAPADELYAVPEDDMRALHRLARLGNMRDIQQWAERAAALDERHAPFAAQLRALAKAYQSKAILQLVERHLDEKEA
ncbi:response regulator [Trinickia terrae]|uniref:Sensory/regulatory protein RpfC n=1 Tax=Trinickia terrae TaxID=2571161 RepID=A0A4U1IF17_9BURK|nr:ATP-binding protein [Trinickia terrae]TKC92309.1 response regulator [Trinickia terrae]